MGIGIVLVFWAVVGAILSGIGLVLIGGATAFLTRGVTRGRSPVIIAACLFPFACFAWAGIIFVFQAIVNESLLHRDIGLGDTWHCPIPNGYQIMMIDVTDQGWVYNPKTQGTFDVVTEQEDAVAGVRTLQVAGPYILGGVDLHAFEQMESGTKQVNSYFILDTRIGKKTMLPNYDLFRSAARQFGIQPKLESINEIYSRYRFSWFEVFVGIVFCIPLLVGFLLLIWWIIRLRRRRDLIPAQV
jgi:hypothetical protein